MPDGDGLERMLEDMVASLPVGFSVTIGLTRTDGSYVANAAIHSQDPGGKMVMSETAQHVRHATRALADRLNSPEGKGNGSPPTRPSTS